VRRRLSRLASLAPLGRALTRLLRQADGAEAIEFAIVANALLLFLLGVVEFGRLYWTQSELQYAAEATARYATIYTVNNPSATTAQIKTAAQTQAPTYLYSLSVPASATFNVTPYSPGPPPAPFCGNEVTITYPFSFIVTGLFPWSITLTAQGCYQG
jgi:Flp pilus assembly protein TadG